MVEQEVFGSDTKNGGEGKFLRLVEGGECFGRNGREADRGPFENRTDPRTVLKAFCKNVSSPGCAGYGLEDVDAGVCLFGGFEDVRVE